jgi:hypothetical protein
MKIMKIKYQLMIQINDLPWEWLKREFNSCKGALEWIKAKCENGPKNSPKVSIRIYRTEEKCKCLKVIHIK